MSNRSCSHLLLHFHYVQGLPRDWIKKKSMQQRQKYPDFWSLVWVKPHFFKRHALQLVMQLSVLLICTFQANITLQGLFSQTWQHCRRYTTFSKGRVLILVNNKPVDVQNCWNPPFIICTEEHSPTVSIATHTSWESLQHRLNWIVAANCASFEGDTDDLIPWFWLLQNSNGDTCSLLQRVQSVT